MFTSEGGDFAIAMLAGWGGACVPGGMDGWLVVGLSGAASGTVRVAETAPPDHVALGAPEEERDGCSALCTSARVGVRGCAVRLGCMP